MAIKREWRVLRWCERRNRWRRPFVNVELNTLFTRRWRLRLLNLERSQGGELLHSVYQRNLIIIKTRPEKNGGNKHCTYLKLAPSPRGPQRSLGWVPEEERWSLNPRCNLPCLHGFQLVCGKISWCSNNGRASNDALKNNKKYFKNFDLLRKSRC